VRRHLNSYRLSNDKPEARQRITHWIELANFIQPGMALPAEPANKVLANIWKQWRVWSRRSLDPRWLAAEVEGHWRRELMAGMPLRETAASAAYGLVRQVHQIIEAIAASFPAAESPAKTGPKRSRAKAKVSEPPEEEWGPLALPPLTPIAHLNSEGGISCSYGPIEEFRQILQAVEAYKIRRCKFCTRFFYATRSDKITCSMACQNALRQQRWRDKAKEYEVNRRRYREDGIPAKQLIQLHAALRGA
jgi:hypothetical protein